MEITSQKVIEFYERNEGLDINKMNEYQVDMLDTIIGGGANVSSENSANDIKNFLTNFKLEMFGKISDNNSEYKNDIRSILKSDTNVDQIVEKKLENFGKVQNEMMNSVFQQLPINDKLVRIDVRQDEMNNKINEFLGKKENSNEKGRMSENELKLVLDEIFSTGVVEKISNEAHSCDIILKREGKEDILVENKDYKTKIPLGEVEKFISDTENKKKHGIFISQFSTIANKDDYQIDVDGDRVLVYVCNVNYDKDKIRTAVKIIDHFALSMDKIENTNDTENVKKEILEKFNDDYKKNLTAKMNLISMLKENHKKELDLLKKMEMPTIDKFLNERFAHAQNTSLICQICMKYTGTTLRGLKKHQMHCKKVNEEKVQIDKIEIV